MINILRTLVFFPSVTFSILPGVAIFPWTFLYILLEGLKLSYFLMLILFFFFLSWLVNINLSHLDVFQVLRSLFAFLNPLFIFVFLVRQANESVILKFVKLLKYIFYFLIVLGILQYTGILKPFDSFFHFLVPGASGITLGGIRGVTLLSSEPSRAGYEFLFIYLGYRYFFLNNSLKRIIFDLFVFLYQAIIIKSATGTLYTLIFLMIWYYKYLPIIFAFLIFVFFCGSYFKIESKGIYVLTNMFNILKTFNLDELHYFLLNVSGFRLISIEAAYYYGIIHPFGGGLGNWEIASVQAFKNLGLDPSLISFFRDFGNADWIPVRPTSYFAGLFLESGFVISILLLIYILKQIKFCFLITYDRILPYILFFLFYLFIMGSIGNPVPWVVVGIIIGFVRLNFGHGGEYRWKYRNF